MKTHIHKKVKKKRKEKRQLPQRLDGVLTDVREPKQEEIRSAADARSLLGIAAFNLNVGGFIAVCFVYL